MMLSRRKFLHGIGAAAAVTAVPLKIAEPAYGLSPMVAALPSLRRYEMDRIAWQRHWAEVAEAMLPRRLEVWNEPFRS